MPLCVVCRYNPIYRLDTNTCKSVICQMYYNKVNPSDNDICVICGYRHISFHGSNQEARHNKHRHTKPANYVFGKRKWYYHNFPRTYYILYMQLQHITCDILLIYLYKQTRPLLILVVIYYCNTPPI